MVNIEAYIHKKYSTECFMRPCIALFPGHSLVPRPLWPGNETRVLVVAFFKLLGFN